MVPCGLRRQCGGLGDKVLGGGHGGAGLGVGERTALDVMAMGALPVEERGQVVLDAKEAPFQLRLAV